LVGLRGISINRREGAIFLGMKEALAIVRSTEQEIPGLVAAVAEDNAAGWKAKRARIFELESQSDQVHRNLSSRIAEGAFFGGVREDILNLLEKIDNIADKAKDAARLITLARITDAKAIRVLRSDDMRQFLANLDLAVVALQRLIEAFEIDRKAILERVHAVEEFEEAADSFKQNVLGSLFDASEGGIDPVTVILVMDFLFAADDVADNAEDASDVVLVLVAKGYG